MCNMKAPSLMVGKKIMAKVKVFVHAHANTDTRAMTLALRTFVPARQKVVENHAMTYPYNEFSKHFPLWNYNIKVVAIMVTVIDSSSLFSTTFTAVKNLFSLLWTVSPSSTQYMRHRDLCPRCTTVFQLAGFSRYSQILFFPVQSNSHC